MRSFRPALTLGQLIKAKRTSMQMTQSEYATFAGIGVNALGRIESGNENCTLGATFSVLFTLGILLVHESAWV